jgi:acetylornithine deacetylase/succinyl-diaminopimelate desuccinylase-like protein
LQQLLEELKQEDPDFQAKVSYAFGTEQCYTGETIQGERFFPAWLFGEDDTFVQAALRGLKEAGFNPEITHYSFCTNGSHYAGEQGIKTIGFGPSKENLAHTIDEYIEIEQLEKATQGYYGILKAVLQEAELQEPETGATGREAGQEAEASESAELLGLSEASESLEAPRSESGDSL